MQIKFYKTLGTISALLAVALMVFCMSTNNYRLTDKKLEDTIEDSAKLENLNTALQPLMGKIFHSKFTFSKAYKTGIDKQNEQLQKDGEDEIDNDYTTQLLTASAEGPAASHQNLFLFCILALFTLGSVLITYSYYGKKQPGINNDHVFHKPMTTVRWPAIILGLTIIAFYTVLYWYGFLLADLVLIARPLSKLLNGGNGNEDFLYGLIYTAVVVLMAIKMFIKYRHSAYQKVRTVSVTFFQLSFAFIVPEILASLNKPAVDLKNIWPLDDSFFYGSNISELLSNGKLGIFILVWGIALVVIAVPLFTYFFGKRWYCSWVCGCGGLAETAGDPYRHLSSKKLSAWKIERISINSVLILVVITTGVSLINYFSHGKILGNTTEEFQKWYGFFIGAIFAGIIGTGFYPFMGSRMWCRFGCPLAAIFGMIQRYKSRFRITTNGGQCISCGNCSTYCEMGIDVRWYAQRQQNIVRSSCVGCGICAEVCPRGVLKLENGKTENRINSNPIIIGNDGIKVIS
jgi:Pyruvate/2-oxoacid:ferredoxin oxidoreductase delta subunit